MIDFFKQLIAIALFFAPVAITVVVFFLPKFKEIVLAIPFFIISLWVGSSAMLYVQPKIEGSAMMGLSIWIMLFITAFLGVALLRLIFAIFIKLTAIVQSAIQHSSPETTPNS